MGMAPDEGGVEDRRWKRVGVVLKQHADRLCRAPPRQARELGVVQQHATAGGGAQPGQRVQQGGLADAVAAQHAPNLVARDRQVELAADPLLTNGDIERFGAQQRHEENGRAPRWSRTRNTGTPTKAVTTPTGSCCGASSVRARVSAQTSSVPPSSTAAGTSRR